MNYRGELKVILINLDREEQIIEPGERIAQLVFAKVERVELIETKEIDENTDRGATGYGASGRF